MRQRQYLEWNDERRAQYPPISAPLGLHMESVVQPSEPATRALARACSSRHGSAVRRGHHGRERYPQLIREHPAVGDDDVARDDSRRSARELWLGRCEQRCVSCEPPVAVCASSEPVEARFAAVSGVAVREDVDDALQGLAGVEGGAPKAGMELHLRCARAFTRSAILDEGSKRASIIAAALKHVPAHGWSTHALAAGAVDLGFSPSAHAIVQGGGGELVSHVQESADERLRKVLGRADASNEKLTVAQRLSFAMKLRLSFVAPYAPVWAQALALQALPSQLPATLNRASWLCLVLDEYAHSVPATSPDRSPFAEGMPLGEESLAARLLHPSACARRAAIGVAYGLAELHMVADASATQLAGVPSHEVHHDAQSAHHNSPYAASFAHVDQLCAALERGALSFDWAENELAHAAVHSRLLLGTLEALKRRGWSSNR